MQFADIILKSSAIFTGKSEQVFSGGVAIAGNRIIAVGKDDEIDSLKGIGTEVYQFGDNLILPGFNDSHFHFAYGCALEDDSFCVDLSGCRSEEECAALVQKFAAKWPNNPWIFGRGWNHWAWDKPVMPTRASLDRVVPDRPVCLGSWDLHEAWVNKKALEVCNIDRNTPDPDGGFIVKDEDGKPNGILQEVGATALALKLALNVPDLKSAVKKFLRKAAKLGITSVGDVAPLGVSNDNVYALYKELEDEGVLTTRISFYPEMESDLNEVRALQQLYSSEKLRIAGLKKIIDGVCESHTGYMVDPYTDDPTTRSHSLVPDELLKAQVINANKEGFAVRLHAIGDAAVRLCLDSFETSQIQNGKNGLRNAIEHIENIQPSDIERFSKLDVIASMQPLHVVSNIDGYPVLVGEERVKRAWAMKTLLKTGAKLAFSTDFPVVDADPIQSIYAAVTRTTTEGYPTGGFVPEEKLSLAETLQGLTYGSAYVENFEKDLGTLEVEKLADIVVLSKNLFDVTASEILDTRVLLTVMDGNVIYEG